MSSVEKINFEPRSNLMHLQTRDFALVDPTLVNPLNALATVDGEWMEITATYKMQRAANIAAAGNAATAQSYPLWAERGRTDVQARCTRAAPVLWLGQWEADTRIFLVTNMVMGGLVSVSSVNLNGKIVSALVANGTIAAAGAGITVGFITRLPAANGGKLRLRGGMLF
jgi:hypothetical protein